MKNSLFTFALLFVLVSCSSTESKSPEPVTESSERVVSISSAQQPLNNIEKHLKNLIIAQKNYFNFTGRWSMTINTLVKSDFLAKDSGDILANKVKYAGWKFKQSSLPFPDEDVSWCYTAHGPQGQIVLAAHNGMWKRNDGKLPLKVGTLPPHEPWVKINN